MMLKFYSIILFLTVVCLDAYSQKTISYAAESNEGIDQVINVGDKGFLLQTYCKAEVGWYKYTMYDWDLNEKWRMDTKKVYDGKNYYPNHFLVSPYSNKVFIEIKFHHDYFKSSKPKEGDIMDVVIDDSGKSEVLAKKESIIATGNDQFGADFVAVINDKIVFGGYESVIKKNLTLMLFWVDPLTGEIEKKETDILRPLDELKHQKHNTPGMLFLGNTENSLLLAKKIINDKENGVTYTVYEIDFEGKLVNTIELTADINGTFTPTSHLYTFFTSEEESSLHQISIIDYSRNIKGDIVRRLNANTFQEGYLSDAISAYHSSNIKYDDKYGNFYIYGLTDLSGKGKEADSYFVYRFNKEGKKIAGNQLKVNTKITNEYSKKKWPREFVELNLVSENVVQFCFYSWDLIGIIYTDGNKTLSEDMIKKPKVDYFLVEECSEISRLSCDSKNDNGEAGKHYKRIFANRSKNLSGGDRYYDKIALVEQSERGSSIEITVYK